jgi:hypothetical protein
MPSGYRRLPKPNRQPPASIITKEAGILHDQLLGNAQGTLNAASRIRVTMIGIMSASPRKGAPRACSRHRRAQIPYPIPLTSRRSPRSNAYMETNLGFSLRPPQDSQ